MYLLLVENEHEKAECVNRNVVATMSHNEYNDVFIK